MNFDLPEFKRPWCERRAVGQLPLTTAATWWFLLSQRIYALGCHQQDVRQDHQLPPRRRWGRSDSSAPPLRPTRS